MLESKIEAWLNHQIKKIGGKSYKFVSPGNPGVPDRIYILPGGKIYFVELKSDTGKLSQAQRWQKEKLEKLGTDVRTIYGMGQAKEFIKELKDGVYTTCVPGENNTRNTR